MSKLIEGRLRLMLKGLIEWFDKQLSAKGTAATVRSVFAIMGFSVAMAAIPGVPAVKVGVLALGVVFALIFALVLLRDRLALKQEVQTYQELLSRYCKFIAGHPKAAYRVASWEERAVIDESGDTDGEVTIELVTVRKAVYFLQFKFRAGWVQPARYWKKTKIDVHLLQDNGARVPDSEVTKTWEPDGRLDVIYHLHRPVPSGTKLRLQISWHWPGKSLPLMMRKTDSFFFNFTKSSPVDYASYVVVLPKGFDAHFSPIGFTTSDSRFSLGTGIDKGCNEFVFEGVDIPLNKRVGMMLQLKQEKEH